MCDGGNLVKTADDDRMRAIAEARLTEVTEAIEMLKDLRGRLAAGLAD